jgi:protein TonB
MMGPIETKVIEDVKPKQEELPPPPPKLQTPPPYVPPPDLDIAMEVQQAPTESRAIASVTNKVAPVAVAPPAPDVEPRFDPRGRYNSFPDSEYPSQSRRANEEGKVLISVLVQADNSVGDVKVVQTSGFERLDEAAVEWYRKRGRFVAATKDGKPIAAWMTFAVKFQLKK